MSKRLLHFAGVPLILAALSISDVRAQNGAETVLDSAYTIPLSIGETVEVFPSTTNKRRFYVAPIMNFYPFDRNGTNILYARHAPLNDQAGAAQLSFLLSVPEVLEEIRTELARKQVRGDDGAVLTREQIVIDILRIDAIRLDVLSDDYRALYDVRPFILNKPPSRQNISMELSARINSRELVDRINSGDIQLLVTYGYNEVSLDESRRVLSLSQAIETKAFRDLRQRGAEVFTAQQMAQAANAIRTEITDSYYPGLGKIEERTLSAEELLRAFGVVETWRATQEQLRSMDERLHRQLNLNIDPKDYQPFSVQREVVDIVNSETDLKTKQRNYFEAFDRSRQKWNVSVQGGYPPYFGGSANYESETENLRRRENLSEREFAEHISKHHGVSYRDEIKLFRGLEVYDLQQIESRGAVNITTVTYRPDLRRNIRNLSVRLNPKDETQVTRLELRQRGIRVGPGTAEFVNASGQRIFFAGRDAGQDGSAFLYNDGGQRVVSLGTSVNNNGFAEFRNSAGQQVTYIGSSSGRDGMLDISNNSGKTVASIRVNAGGFGQISLFNPDGNRTARLTTDSAGGFAEFYDAQGKEVVYLGASRSGRGMLTLNGRGVNDVSEIFELATRDGVAPGTVMSISQHGDGVEPSRVAYDSRAVGVVSGAGGLTPGLILGSRTDTSNDHPVAVTGQVYVRVINRGNAVRVGDLLVSSDIPGVAMRVEDRERALGTVIGKALEDRVFAEDQTEELVRMLVMNR
ncbi:hypothetical protein [Roseomonas chloroacetimidivorans]|uniref:hypothetical protein n=1 Tax=Roseomonas chloroacetimidivorans TaxID=1766656 RepID=UPI003C77F79D